MEIDDPRRMYTVEPVDDPVPRERPAESPESPLEDAAEPAQSDERVMLAPDYVEPVRAWRTWLLVQGNGGLTLRSVLFPVFWHPAVPAVAECLGAPSMLDRLRLASVASVPGAPFRARAADVAPHASRRPRGLPRPRRPLADGGAVEVSAALAPFDPGSVRPAEHRSK